MRLTNAPRVTGQKQDARGGLNRFAPLTTKSRAPCDLDHRQPFLGPLCRTARNSAPTVCRTPLSQGDPMRAIHSCLSRLSIAAATILLLTAVPGLGQNMPVPCSAFARNAHG